MTKRITESIDYSAVSANDGTIELHIVRNGIQFVEEVIPDGQMAGMMGHRPVPCVDEMTFTLYPGQAQALHEELGRALQERRR